MHPSDPPLLAGRYRLGECLGEGGMARVYRAEDVALGRTVAIKRMRGTLDDHEPRVRSEMTLLAALNHPSLVTLFDAHLGDDPRSAGGEGDFLVMEYVEGPTLSRCLADGPLPPHTAAALAMDLADALHAVHAAGIVHRDIKPSNILLSPSPLPMRQFRAKLADFGIAYLRDSARITSPGIVLGTAAYLAPEQVRGEAPTPAADIFSLGLVLLEALTGLRAYRHASGAEALVVRLSTAPDIPPDLSDGWRELLLAMTSLEAADRPTALDVAVAASALTTTATLVTMPPAAPAAPVPPTPVPPARDAAAQDAATPNAPLQDTVAMGATLPATLPATVPAPVALRAPAEARLVPLAAPSPAVDGPSGEVEDGADDKGRRSRRTTLFWGAAAVVSLIVAGGAGALTGAFGTAGAVPTVISEPAPVRLIPELPPTEQVAEVTTDEAATVEPVVPAGQTVTEPDPPAADTPPAGGGTGGGANGAGDPGAGGGPGSGGPGSGGAGGAGAGPGNGNGSGNGAGAGGGNGSGGPGNGSGGPGNGNGNGGSGPGNGDPGSGTGSTPTPDPTPTPAPSEGSEEEATLG